MKCDILFSRNFSNNLEKTGKREMGRNSCKDFGDDDLGIMTLDTLKMTLDTLGMTLDTLKASGNVSSLTHLLNSFTRVGVRIHL